MLSHVSIACSDLAAATAFYDAVLAPLDCVRVYSGATASGYGLRGGGERFAIKQRPVVVAPGSGFHLAFEATAREGVDAFHREAIAHGAKDEGAPGLRPHFGDDYYAAFVRDLDGHLIECVCQPAP